MTEPLETHLCTLCLTDLPTASFSPSMLRSGGWCRDCVNKRKRDKRNGVIPQRDFEVCQWTTCDRSLAGRRRQAKYCSSACAAKAFRQENPDYQRGAMIRHQYGIDVEQFDALLADQGGVCGCCKEPEPEDRGGRKTWWVIDHDHTTHEIRGVLCNHCNTGLGQFKDDPARLQAGIYYLTSENRLINHVIPTGKGKRRSPSPAQLTPLGARIRKR